MTAPRWGLPESHLLPDAVVAFVDGELSLGAMDRAAAHIARCASCAADVTAQRQVVAAVKRAGEPSMSAGFLASLRAIPEQTELPSAPDNLAVTADGQLVAIQRPDRVAGLRETGVLGGTAPIGSAAPLGQSPNVLGGGRFGGARKRAAQGAGVVVSGLVLSALALVGTSGDSGSDAGTDPASKAPQNANLLPARMAVAPSAQLPAPAPTSVTPVVPAAHAPAAAR
ncbi:anti-sigma factor family protein [Amycolatopsis sp. NPDC059021]|uniref:anti-sigma factor family protein n=1 Tax=Amycolatopsis sp. NPDC059021 TaxID=3346704 RepID=UPI00366CE65A